MQVYPACSHLFLHTVSSSYSVREYDGIHHLSLILREFKCWSLLLKPSLSHSVTEMIWNVSSRHGLINCSLVFQVCFLQWMANIKAARSIISPRTLNWKTPTTFKMCILIEQRLYYVPQPSHVLTMFDSASASVWMGVAFCIDLFVMLTFAQRLFHFSVWKEQTTVSMTLKFQLWNTVCDVTVFSPLRG